MFVVFAGRRFHYKLGDVRAKPMRRATPNSSVSRSRNSTGSSKPDVGPIAALREFVGDERHRRVSHRVKLRSGLRTLGCGACLRAASGSSAPDRELAA